MLIVIKELFSLVYACNFLSQTSSTNISVIHLLPLSLSLVWMFEISLAHKVWICSWLNLYIGLFRLVDIASYSTFLIDLFNKWSCLWGHGKSFKCVPSILNGILRNSPESKFDFKRCDFFKEWGEDFGHSNSIKEDMNDRKVKKFHYCVSWG